MLSSTYSNNGNPQSVAVKTGSYTIPAGNYAFITAECRAGETFSIDGTVALQCQGTTNGLVGVSQSAATSTTYAVPSGCWFEGQGYSSSGTLGITVGGDTVCSGVTVSPAGTGVALKAGPGDSVVVSSSSGVAHLTGYARPLVDGPAVGTFWVPSGTSLTVSSARYTVALY